MLRKGRRLRSKHCSRTQLVTEWTLVGRRHIREVQTDTKVETETVEYGREVFPLVVIPVTIGDCHRLGKYLFVRRFVEGREKLVRR